MKREFKTASQIRAEKEKLVMENFASVMKKLDDTFLIENHSVGESNEELNEGESDDERLNRFRGYEYYLDGQRVDPHINWYNNYIGAELDGEYYKVQQIDGNKWAIYKPKGRTGMYT